MPKWKTYILRCVYELGEGACRALLPSQRSCHWVASPPFPNKLSFSRLPSSSCLDAATMAKLRTSVIASLAAWAIAPAAVLAAPAADTCLPATVQFGTAAAAGYKTKLVLSGLDGARGIVFDPTGHLIAVSSGVGLVRLTLTGSNSTNITDVCVTARQTIATDRNVGGRTRGKQGKAQKTGVYRETNGRSTMAWPSRPMARLSTPRRSRPCSPGTTTRRPARRPTRRPSSLAWASMARTTTRARC